MAKKDEITLVDALVHALHELLAAIDNGNEERIGEIEKFLWILSDTAEKHYSGVPMKVIEFVDDMTASIGDYFHGSRFKSTFPTEDEIRRVLED